jgi:hypothetical protein
MLRIMFLVSLESSWRGGWMGLVPWHLDLGCKSSWILNDFFTENFGGIGMCLWCCWKYLDEQDLWIYLVGFGFWMWEILICRWFLPLKIKLNSKKSGFGRKNQLRTWRVAIQFKHDFLSYLAIQKINTYIAKQCSHVEFPYFVMRSHLGQWQGPH